MVVKLTVSEALPVMIAGFVDESARMSTKGATRRCRQVVRLEGMGGLCVAERVSVSPVGLKTWVSGFVMQ